jgi:Secretion system C-terminal sorting domain
MKKQLHLSATLLLAIFFSFTTTLSSQTVTVSGACLTGTITLSIAPNVNGKVCYTGVGTVAGFANTAVSIQWIGAPDNIWALQFDGQPFFTNATSGAKPLPSPSVWTNLDAVTCPNTTPISVGGTALPIELTSFIAKLNNNKTVLVWQTASEKNNQGFEIQRSTDGKDWLVLNFVKGVGTATTTQNYQFTDEKPNYGINYYRLKQIDFDGISVYSKTISVDNIKNLIYKISPNPTKGSFIVHTPTPDNDTPLSISVFDLLGRQVLNQKSQNGETMLDLSAFSAGTYIVEMQYGKQVYREKLIKQ